jgi:SNF family Na+-dependent transporter
MVSSLVSPLPWTAEAVDMSLAAARNQSASEYFWAVEVLHKFDSLEGQGLGPVQPKIAGALLGVWLTVFLSLAFGKAVLAKVTLVTVVGPVLLLLVMLVQTCQLDGASDGITYYIGKFDWHRLLEPEVWSVACGQILFSLSPGCGTAITMSSYTAPKEDTYRVCLIVALSNSAFSLTGGFAIFSILGNLAKQTGRTVQEVAGANGPGLAFISIAEGVSTFGAGANAMAVLFFAMLLSLGLDSTFAWAETFVCYIDDFFISIQRPRPKWQIVAITSAVLFLAGLPFCTRGGLELLDVTDRYGVSYYLLIGCFLEICMFHLDFGWARLAAHVRQATIGNKATPRGRKFWPAAFWKLCLYVTAPVITFVLFLQLWAKDLSTPYQGYPAGFQAYGWTLLMALMLLTPVTMFKLDSSPGSLQELNHGASSRSLLKAVQLMLGAPGWKSKIGSSPGDPAAPSVQNGVTSTVELTAAVAPKPLGEAEDSGAV